MIALVVFTNATSLGQFQPCNNGVPHSLSPEPDPDRKGDLRIPQAFWRLAMLYPLMNIVGPILLLAVITWAVIYTKGRSRREDRATDKSARRLREELNEEDTAGRSRD